MELYGLIHSAPPQFTLPPLVEAGYYRAYLLYHAMNGYVRVFLTFVLDVEITLVSRLVEQSNNLFHLYKHTILLFTQGTLELACYSQRD